MTGSFFFSSVPQKSKYKQPETGDSSGHLNYELESCVDNGTEFLRRLSTSRTDIQHHHKIVANPPYILHPLIPFNEECCTDLRNSRPYLDLTESNRVTITVAKTLLLTNEQAFLIIHS